MVCCCQHSCTASISSRLLTESMNRLIEALHVQQDRCMGIRYYAYAFDADVTERALADPRRFISGDPLADAWGMPHGAQCAVASFEQSVPKTEMLYLDKAWSSLQALTAPSVWGSVARPAYRMFEGQVAMQEYGWTPWVRAIAPDEVAEIAEDLAGVLHDFAGGASRDDDSGYVLDYLERAVGFVKHSASARRGFAYLIG